MNHWQLFASNISGRCSLPCDEHDWKTQFESIELNANAPPGVSFRVLYMVRSNAIYQKTTLMTIILVINRHAMAVRTFAYTWSHI